MLVKLYGLIDLFAGLSILLLKFFEIGSISNIILAISALIAIKSFFYIKDIASIIDLIGVVFIILACLGIHNSFSYIFAIWFIQKGVISLFFS